MKPRVEFRTVIKNGFAVCAALLAGAAASAETIDFTRFLHRSELPAQAAFKALPGPARLAVDLPRDKAHLRVVLNGQLLALPATTQTTGVSFELPVSLRAENVISISNVDSLSLPKEPLATQDGAPLQVSEFEVRVRQEADVELNVISRVHFNTNVSDFSAAREFYGKLGFSTLTGFPDTNTQAMARAIGIETPTSYDGHAGGEAGGYQLHGELIGLGFMSGAIDLIEFSIPRDETPPYSSVNHLGMAKATFFTTDIAADYAYLDGLGVELMAAPVNRADGTAFFLFKDLDGTFYELREQSGEVDDTETTHITGFGPLTINVSDIERSSAWYRMMGHEVTQATWVAPADAVAEALGFDDEISYEIANATLPGDASSIELVQWQRPVNTERPYPIPVNHLGIHRTAFATSDIEADVATLKAQGVEFVSPITPCCSGPDSSGRIVAFYDPDGTIVELVEQPAMNWVLPALLWFRDTFL